MRSRVLESDLDSSFDLQPVDESLMPLKLIRSIGAWFRLVEYEDVNYTSASSTNQKSALVSSASTHDNNNNNNKDPRDNTSARDNDNDDDIATTAYIIDPSQWTTTDFFLQFFSFFTIYSALTLVNGLFVDVTLNLNYYLSCNLRRIF